MEWREMWKLKSIKFNQNIEILKQYFKIFTYEDWEFLISIILTLFRDDLRSDFSPVTVEVVAFWPWFKPFHFPSLISQAQCCPELQYGSRPSNKTPQNFLVGPELKIPSGFPQQFLSWLQISFCCNHAVIILVWPDETKIP